MGNLSTPKSVQKLQMALHAKAKAEAGYRFYVLYDKIGREDILAHAYAQCRSNKGAPGVDGQDLALRNGGVLLRSGVLGIFNSRTQTVKGKNMSTAKRTPMRTREMKPNRTGRRFRSRPRH